ncbi:MAG: maltokinase N-terminal cap-like domain-containing protein, partial [Candidatus Binatia bacterium]
MSPGLPRLRVAGSPEAALRAEVLDSLGLDAVAAYVRDRRWFGGKGRAATAVRFRDVTPLFPGTAVARLEIELAGAARALYQLPLAVRGDEATSAAPLARVEAAKRPALLFDAVEDPEFRERLGAAFAAGAVFEGKRTRWVVEPIDETGRWAIPPGTAGALSRAEQSNTSIRYGEHGILKLYRRLERGENPDAEIGVFLVTRTSFRNVPRLFGTIRFEDGDGSRMIAAMLQAFVPGSRDAWSHALSVVEGRLGTGFAAELPFAAEAVRLGEITRGLHEALASDPTHPDFAPEPVTADDLATWREHARAQALQSLVLLRGQRQLRGEAASLLERRDELLRAIDESAVATGESAGAKIRHHGDYHLGQLLRDPRGDFVVIDFEGEPARPLAERRRRHSPL